MINQIIKITAPTEAKIIFITGQTELETLQLALSTNPISYLTKPVRKNDLVAAITLFTGRLRAARFLYALTGPVPCIANPVSRDRNRSRIVRSSCARLKRRGHSQLPSKI